MMRALEGEWKVGNTNLFVSVSVAAVGETDSNMNPHKVLGRI